MKKNQQIIQPTAQPTSEDPIFSRVNFIGLLQILINVQSYQPLLKILSIFSALEIREDIDTTLVPGMVVSMEPMITIPEGMPGAGGYREHDILVVQEDGAEDITHFPYGPEHNIIKK